MSYRQLFAEWFDKQRKEGMVSFTPLFNLRVIAEKFGADVIQDDCGMDRWLDFSATPFRSISHPEVMDFIYEELYKFVTSKK